MKITDLKIGDMVCDKKTKFPMHVVGIFEDGTVYLDFEHNEGGNWEDDIKNLEFVDEKKEC